MSNRQNGAKKNSGRPFIAVLLAVVLLACAAGLFIYNRNNTQSKETENTAETAEGTEKADSEDTDAEAPAASAADTPEDSEDSEEEAETEDTGLMFPYTVDGENLEIGSLFQYSGPNPDCGNEQGEDVGSIQLTNKSGKYLETADITINLANGIAYVFHVEGLPDGKTVLALDTTNQTYDGKSGAADIEAETAYSENASLKEDALSVSNDEEGIHLTNISGEELKNINVKYHCDMDDMYFGGLCYEGTVESLAAGADTVLDTSECYMGEAVVVNITY